MAEGQGVERCIQETFPAIERRVDIRMRLVTAPQAVKLGLGAPIKCERKAARRTLLAGIGRLHAAIANTPFGEFKFQTVSDKGCLLYTSDAADE